MEEKKEKPKDAKPAKVYDILKHFNHTTDGVARHYSPGEQAELSAALAAVAVRKGWAREVKPCAS